MTFAACCGAGLRCRSADVRSGGQCRTRRDPDHIESECDDGNTGHCNLPLVRASGALAWHVSVPKRADHRSDRARWARVLEAVDLGVREFQLKPASLQARVLSRAPWSPDQVIDTASPSANPGHAGGRECSPCTTGPKLKSDINSIRVRSFILTGAPLLYKTGHAKTPPLEAATSVRSSSVLDPMMRTSFASTSTR
jgi:hypothetical protein